MSEILRDGVPEPSYWRVLTNVKAFFGLLSLIFGMMLWTKIDTTMADKL
jgi:hypothetical protein